MTLRLLLLPVTLGRGNVWYCSSCTSGGDLELLLLPPLSLPFLERTLNDQSVNKYLYLQFTKFIM